MKEILLGVCGSIAAYKAALLIRAVRKQQCAVQTIASPQALEFIGAATLRALTGRPVATDDFRAPLSPDGMDHITLPRNADCFVVAPASADFLAKAASGAADNLLLAAFLAADCPRFVAPAMNQQMWRANATRRNLQTLANDGVFILSPAEGEQACGETGPGRMMEPDDIAAQLIAQLAAPLAGRRVVVSTGATAEPIDDMRLITNVSSGKMGFCIAQAARSAGANVVIVAGQTTAEAPYIPLRRAITGKEMKSVLLEECKTADIFISVAAVADFVPDRKKTGKIPRHNGGITLNLAASDDILAAVIKRFPHLFAVGFAAQSGAAAARIAAAKQKMLRKNTAMMIANAAQDAGGDSSQLTIITPSGATELPRQSKSLAAAQLITHIAGEIVSRETLQEAK